MEEHFWKQRDQFTSWQQRYSIKLDFWYLSPLKWKLFQKLCPNIVDWDCELQGDLLKSWTLLLKELRCLSSVRIPRYFQSTPVKCKLHSFCDTSHLSVRRCYLYWSCLFQWKNWCSFARPASKFATTVSQLRTFNWTDSMTALCWINNKKVIHIASKRFENWRRATVGDIALVNSSRLIYLLVGWVRETLLKKRFGGMEHRLFTNRKQDALRTNQLEN